MKIKKFNEGVTKIENNFIFDFEHDTPDDILNIASVQIKETSIGDNVYWFGYEFNDNIDSDTRTRFIHWIKGLYTDKENRPSSAELYRFIDRPIAQLSKKVSFVTFNSIIYPRSNRSDLVKSIIRVVLNYIDRDSERLTFELVKSLPENIEFDLKAIRDVCGDDTHKYNQIEKHVAQSLLPKIKALSYFSIAETIRPKYRSYVKNFLNFETEETKKAFEALDKPKTLIIDDINTSGATITEMVRIIKKVNPSAEIYIFTLLGKDFSI